MAVIKEWECKAHGYFDGPDQVCPHGCPQQFVDRVFLTPPAVRSQGTVRSDKMLDQLAKDYGMTDIKNDKDGTSVANATNPASMSFKPQWGALGKNFDVSGMGVQPGNALASIQPALKNPSPSHVLGRFDG